MGGKQLKTLSHREHREHRENHQEQSVARGFGFGADPLLLFSVNSVTSVAKKDSDLWIN
jgi:hypothetical protein